VNVTLRQIFISPGHNFFGHHGQPAGQHPMLPVPTIRCRAGWGIEGDRFYGYRPDYKGQITFFSWEVYEACRKQFNVPALVPEAFRRNVLIEGVDLNTLVGRRFTLGGVELEGTEESRPCYWMNQAIAAGAEDWMRGQGGLRAKVLSDGSLHAGPAELMLAQAVA